MPRIIHNPAQGSEPNPLWDKIVHLTKSLRVGRIPNDLTVVTWNNRPNKGMIEQSLDRMGIPHLSLGRGTYWHGNNNKLDLLIQSFNLIKTTYVMGLDCYDVLIIRDLSDVLDEFHTFGAKLLFNATVRNFPNVPAYGASDRLICEGPYCYLNSGVFIGEAEYVKMVFDEALQFPHPDFPKSDQGAIKPIYHREYPVIQIDWQCRLFQIALREADLLLAPYRML